MGQRVRIMAQESEFLVRFGSPALEVRPGFLIQLRSVFIQHGSPVGVFDDLRDDIAERARAKVRRPRFHAI